MIALAGRVAIVTGGASGIGHAIAEALHREGSQVYTADREASPPSPGIVPITMDVSDAKSVAAMTAHVVAEAGRIDILVNSAGIYGAQPWLEIAPEDYRRIFDVNVLGIVLTTQAAAAHMTAAGGGAIVNIASAAGRRGNPTSALYAASKAAVISLTQSAALAFAESGVRVNALAPGRVETPMWDQVVGQRSQTSGLSEAEQRAVLAQGIPLRRMAVPEDYAAPALFLASDASGYMTGQTLNVDGGLQLN